ncbi:MAG: DUF4097 domain-containing protein [Anaerolineales bacterium]
MKNKWFFFSILIVAEIIVLAAIVMVVWQGVSETNLGTFGFRLSNPDLFSAESEEEWRFEVGEIIEVVIDSSGGDIIIEATQADEILVTAHKTAWHSSKSKAQSELEDISITVSQAGNKIVIKYRRDPTMFFVGPQQTDTVDFIISVPEGFMIKAETNFGDISLTGKFSNTIVSTDFGNMDLSGIQGNLEAKSSSGDITATGINGEDINIDLSSDFGEISLSKSRGASIVIHSNSGSVVLNDINANKNIILSSDFGKLVFTKGSTDVLSMIANNGKILVSNVVVESNLIVQTNFGDIELEKTTADIYDVDTSSGKITLVVVGGIIKASSDFGDINVTSTQPAIIDLYTNSGSVDYTGPLGIGPHSLVTDFGDISLHLPKDTAITFDLETDFGKLKTEFPITLEGGVKHDHWRGTLNDGGAELTATTNSGDISFDILNQ